MGLFFEVAAILLLVFIALELHLIRNDLSRLPLILLREAEEKKESPTINVNVGAMPAPPVAVEEAKPVEIIPPPDEKTKLEAVEEEPSEPSPVAEEEPPPRIEPHRGSISINATASGLTAVKCPSCQAENSSYRSECFNCGAKLH